jgi:putative flavoprotein involved in K+ transport
MRSEHETERFDTVIIGGGQAGLAAGHELARRGLPFVILEGNPRIGDQWRSRWQSLRLYSPARFDSLPGMPFPALKSAYPSAKEMGDYLEAYADRDRMPILTGVHVDRLRRRDDSGDGFVVEAGARRFEAGQVIVSTGAFQHPHVPELAGQLDPAINQLHSSAYHGPWQLHDGPVLVVGASHSGADIAHEAALAGHKTYLSGRIHGQMPVPLESRRGRFLFPIVVFVFKHVLTLRTPLGRRAARRVRMGGGSLLRVRRQDLDRVGVQRFEARTEDVRGGKPMLAGGRVLDVANIVWSTGFRPDFGWIDLPIVGEDGWPVQRRGVVPSVPGLYFMGLPFLYAYASMLVAGAGRDAAYVADRLAERVRATQATRGRGAAAPTSQIA